MDTEKWLEPRLKTLVEKIDGLSLKFVSPGNKGVPDRIVLLEGGHMAFAEIKTKGKTLDPLQEFWQRQLRKLGFVCEMIDSEEKLNKFVRDISAF